VCTVQDRKEFYHHALFLLSGYGDEYFTFFYLYLFAVKHGYLRNVIVKVKEQNIVLDCGLLRCCVV
jgi:hypothetical protein